MRCFFFFFFFNDTATTEIYTLSLHDALPIFRLVAERMLPAWLASYGSAPALAGRSEGTRLNSSHMSISYAVFCLKKKKKKICVLSLLKKKKKRKKQKYT